MQARISKLILEINGKRIELTEEEARALKDKLEELFNGKNVIYVPYEKQVNPWCPEPTPYKITWKYADPYTTTSDNTGTYTIGLKTTSGR